MGSRVFQKPAPGLNRWSAALRNSRNGFRFACRNEAVVDRISLDYHPLSGAAKDLGSLALSLAIVFNLLLWASAIAHWRSARP